MPKIIAIKTIDTTIFLGIKLPLEIVILSKDAGGEQDNVKKDPDDTDDETDGDPSLGSLVFLLGLKEQLLFKILVRCQYCIVVQLIRFRGVDDGDDSADQTAENRDDDGHRHLVAVGRDDDVRSCRLGLLDNLGIGFFHN